MFLINHNSNSSLFHNYAAPFSAKVIILFPVINAPAKTLAPTAFSSENFLLFSGLFSHFQKYTIQSFEVLITYLLFGENSNVVTAELWYDQYFEISSPVYKSTKCTEFVPLSETATYKSSPLETLQTPNDLFEISTFFVTFPVFASKK